MVLICDFAIVILAVPVWDIVGPVGIANVCLMVTAEPGDVVGVQVPVGWSFVPSLFDLAFQVFGLSERVTAY